jgi:hypothetical protein
VVGYGGNDAGMGLYLFGMIERFLSCSRPLTQACLPRLLAGCGPVGRLQFA